MQQNGTIHAGNPPKGPQGLGFKAVSQGIPGWGGGALMTIKKPPPPG